MMDNNNNNNNNNNNSLNDNTCYLDIPNPQESIDFSSNQDHITQELQHSEQELKLKEKKKNRDNRKLQRYRQKLHKQGMNVDTIASSSSSSSFLTTSATMVSNDNESKTTMEIGDENIQVLTSNVIQEAIIHRSKAVQNSRIHRQQKKNIKMKLNMNQPLTITEINSLTSAELLKNADNSMDYSDIPDHIFIQMLSTAFNRTNKLDDIFLNEKDKIEFIRHYTGLIGRLSYVKLLQEQWNYYYHIGITQNIWTYRISKHIAQKNSICSTYGRSKRMIQQRRTQNEKQLHQVQTTIELFEKEILSKIVQHSDCSSEIQVLLSMINTFVNEHQQKTRNEFEYKRQMLILDAHDHHLLQTFFNLKPSKSQIICARHIWQATKEQIQLEEQITILEHRRTSISLLSTANLFHRMLDDIDEKLTKSIDIIDQHPSTSFLSSEYKKLKQFKADIIEQSIQTAQAMKKTFINTIHDQQNKFFLKNNADVDRYNRDLAKLNAIEIRRLNMIEHGKYITKQKLITSFKPIDYIEDNIK